jgi:hypothetical protein
LFRSCFHLVWSVGALRRATEENLGDALLYRKKNFHYF